VLRRIITSFRQVGTLYRRDSEVHRLVLVDADGVAQSLRESGFLVEMATSYQSLPLPAGVLAFLARKT
jgi:hypothetical protein